jgi:hypothetical protein
MRVRRHPMSANAAGGPQREVDLCYGGQTGGERRPDRRYAACRYWKVTTQDTQIPSPAATGRANLVPAEAHSPTPPSTPPPAGTTGGIRGAAEADAPPVRRSQVAAVQVHFDEPRPNTGNSQPIKGPPAVDEFPRSWTEHRLHPAGARGPAPIALHQAPEGMVSHRKSNTLLNLKCGAQSVPTRVDTDPARLEPYL